MLGFLFGQLKKKAFQSTHRGFYRAHKGNIHILSRDSLTMTMQNKQNRNRFPRALGISQIMLRFQQVGNDYYPLFFNTYTHTYPYTGLFLNDVQGN